MNGPRIAIVQLADPEGAIPLKYATNIFDTACHFMAQRHGGCAVSMIAWQGHNIDELLMQLHDADRILLWDPDITFDMPATSLALGKNLELLEALDGADVVTAPVLRDEGHLAVFSGTEIYQHQGNFGTGLMKPMLEQREPVSIGGCGCFWMWIHVAALSRLQPPPRRPFLVAGVDVTLSRRFIEGGCTVKVDPRLSVRSKWQASAQWALEPVEAREEVATDELVEAPAEPSDPEVEEPAKPGVPFEP